MGLDQLTNKKCTKKLNVQKMIIREAVNTDTIQIQVVRNGFKENRLSNPKLLTDLDCEEFMLLRGKGWVC
jgi:hypothetical protein